MAKVKLQRLDSKQEDDEQSFAFYGYRGFPSGYFGPEDFGKPGAVPAEVPAALPLCELEGCYIETPHEHVVSGGSLDRVEGEPR